MKTKQEVIKALELCADLSANCDGCPYYDGVADCMHRVMGDAAELLKEATHEI